VVSLAYCAKEKIDLAGVHLVGGVSCNETLRTTIEMASNNFNLPLLTCPKDICVDNAAMIAWNAWELKNAEQDVDISKM